MFIIEFCYTHLIKSLLLLIYNDDIWRERKLVRMVPSHYMTRCRCWLIIGEVLWRSLEQFNRIGGRCPSLIWVEKLLIWNYRCISQGQLSLIRILVALTDWPLARFCSLCTNRNRSQPINISVIGQSFVTCTYIIYNVRFTLETHN